MRPLHSALYDLLGSNCYLPTFLKWRWKKNEWYYTKSNYFLCLSALFSPTIPFSNLASKMCKKPKKIRITQDLRLKWSFFSLLILPRVLCIIRVKSTVIVRILMCKCKTSLCVYAHYNRIWWKKGWFVIKTASQKNPHSNMSTRFFFSASNNNVSLRMTRTHVKYVNCFLTSCISNSERKVNQLHLL